MVTKQQHSKFQYNMTGYLVHWSPKPALWGLSNPLLAFLLLVVLAGVVFFFVPAFNSVPTSRTDNQDAMGQITVQQPSRYSDNFIESSHSNNQELVR